MKYLLVGFAVAIMIMSSTSELRTRANKVAKMEHLITDSGLQLELNDAYEARDFQRMTQAYAALQNFHNSKQSF